MAVAEQADDDAAGGLLLLRLHPEFIERLQRNDPTRGPRQRLPLVDNSYRLAIPVLQRALQLLLSEQDA